MALFDTDGEFGFAFGVFGVIGGPLEKETIVKRKRCGIGERERGVGSREKLYFPILKGTDLHLGR